MSSRRGLQRNSNCPQVEQRNVRLLIYLLDLHLYHMHKHLLFVRCLSEGACGSAEERACAYWTSGPGMLLFFWKNQMDESFAFLEKPKWRKLGSNLGSHAWAAWHSAGEEH
jgi:hypothetical protein